MARNKPIEKNPPIFLMCQENERIFDQELIVKNFSVSFPQNLQDSFQISTREPTI